jgi:uncharacterized protein YjgD (DUF1641 family)
MDKDLELLHQKIDFLTEQVMETKRKQQEWEDLRQDLTPIVSDVFRTAVGELDQISAHFSYEDLLFLIKRLLRNTRTIITVVEQLEGAKDFIQDAGPLTKDMFQSLLHTMNEMEQKGYFVFLNGAMQIVDNIVTSFTEEDVKLLGENVVSILNTVKQLTQPEMMQTIQNALTVYQHINVEPPEKVSMFSLMKEMNDPEVRKGLHTGLTMLKNISADMGKQQKNK